MSQILPTADPGLTSPEPEIVPAGRDATTLAHPFLMVAGLLALVAGLDAFAGSAHTKDFFAWGFASPVSAALVGAGLVGVVPMMLAASSRVLWEGLRIAVVPAAVLVLGMLAVTGVHHDALALTGGGVIALAMAWGWSLAMLALSGFAVLVLLTQLREPGFLLARITPLPRPVVPLIALEGSAFLGLGVGLLVGTDFWAALVPWELSTIDARALGVWCLTLGVALLQALAEDDLERVQPGLVGLAGVGSLGLAALLWHRGEIDWTSWSAPIAVALVGALVVTGVVGLALLVRARSVARAERAAQR